VSSLFRDIKLNNIRLYGDFLATMVLNRGILRNVLLELHVWRPPGLEKVAFFIIGPEKCLYLKFIF
jgi:hypothetical protein